jgi:hypothetical protein
MSWLTPRNFAVFNQLHTNEREERVHLFHTFQRCYANDGICMAKYVLHNVKRQYVEFGASVPTILTDWRDANQIQDKRRSQLPRATAKPGEAGNDTPRYVTYTNLLLRRPCPTCKRRTMAVMALPVTVFSTTQWTHVNNTHNGCGEYSADGGRQAVDRARFRTPRRTGKFPRVLKLDYGHHQNLFNFPEGITVQDRIGNTASFLTY